MKLSAEHRDHYWRRGWVVVEGVFPAERARSMAALAESIARAELEQLTRAPPSSQRRSYWADLRYIDGSHREGLRPHEPLEGEEHNLVPSAELVDLSRESTAPVRAGGVVLHHPLTLHTSYRNESPRWRRGYATHWATRATVSETPIVDNAYYRRPEYQALTSR